MSKKYQRYVPIWDERVFDLIARDCDAYWREQRVKIDKRKKALYSNK